jgi:hypothetical protein
MVATVAAAAAALLVFVQQAEAAAGPTGGSLSVVAHRPSPSSWKRTQCGWRNGEQLNHSANPRWPASATADGDIPTRWGKSVTAEATPLPEYPRPQLVRGAGSNATRLRDEGDPSGWANLNGLWEWEPAAPGNKTAGTFDEPPPFGRTLDSSILVPFPVEACLSGRAPLSSNDLVMWMWYRLPFVSPPHPPSVCCMLWSC